MTNVDIKFYENQVTCTQNKNKINGTSSGKKKCGLTPAFVRLLKILVDEETNTNIGQ